MAWIAARMRGLLLDGEMAARLGRGRGLATLATLALLALAATGCRGSQPVPLDPDALVWRTYVDTAVGYSVSHPEAFRASPEGDGNTLFRLAGDGVPVVVRYTTEEEGRRRGAWFGHPPVEAITLDGVPGMRYVYEHWDLIFATRTVAYVVPLHDRWLGLEFRTSGELSPVQQRMLDTFRLP